MIILDPDTIGTNPILSKYNIALRVLRSVSKEREKRWDGTESRSGGGRDDTESPVAAAVACLLYDACCFFVNRSALAVGLNAVALIICFFNPVNDVVGEYDLLWMSAIFATIF